MKGQRLLLVAAATAILATPAFAELKPGSIDLKRPGPLAFGPKNVLFISDLGNSTVYAVDTGDEARGDRAAALNVEKLDAKIADMIGADASGFVINDMKVNPASGNVYLSVARKQGTGGLIVKVDRGGKVGEFALKNVPCATLSLSKTSARAPAVTALAFSNGRLFIAGMSNEEFNSSLRSVEYPFKESEQITGIEIFHGAHGRWETASPVRTFTPFEINGQSHLLAAYTCTPLVKFSVSDLKAGEKVKGITVAELGNRNMPLDMVVYKKEGKAYILIANSARGVMKVSTDGIENIEAITTPVRGGGTAGLKYETIQDLKGVEQLDRLNDKQALLLVKSGQSYNLRSVDLP